MVSAPKTRVVRPAQARSPQAIWLLLSAIFLSPVLILIAHLFIQGIDLTPRNFDADEALWALKNSCKLGAISAVASIGLGFLLSFGFNDLSARFPRARSFYRQALLFPIYLPPFFVILTLFYWLDFVPMGILASSFAQTLTYAGMAAVLISLMNLEILAPLSEVALVQGISRWKFFWISKRLIFRPLAALAVFIFAVSFSSFSIPLVLSGGKGTTFEILIYEKIKISNEFGLALWFSIAQSVFLGFLFWKIPNQFSIQQGRAISTKYFSSIIAAGILILFLIFLYFPWFGQSPEEWGRAWNQISEAPDFWPELKTTAIASLGLAITAMFACAVLALIYCYQMIQAPLPAYLRSYFPLSVSLLGLSGILLSNYLGNVTAYLFTFVLMIFPATFRLGMDSKMGELQDQLNVAKVLGAKTTQSFVKIVFPQVKGPLATLMGMAFLWTLGDFAVARFFLPAGSTITLLIENLMTSYRIQGALLLGLAVLAAGGIMQLILWKVFDVQNSES